MKNLAKFSIFLSHLEILGPLCGCKGQAWAYGVTVHLTHSGLRILVHKTCYYFLPFLIPTASLEQAS